MEQWDQDYVDLVVPGYFEFRKGRAGEFRFGVVEGELDYAIETNGQRHRLEFSWMGQSEFDPEAGRGWAVIDDQSQLFGKIYFHMGDDSWFKATRST